MNLKSSSLILAFSLSFSSVALAEEENKESLSVDKTEVAEEAAAKENLPVDEAKVAEESQAIIEQTMNAEDEASSSKQPATSTTVPTKKTVEAKEWIPSAVDYDWIQLTSNEWLKGEIKGMYDDNLEFDSDKLDLLDIDWEDVKILRSHRINVANIDGIGAASGILEVTDNSFQLVNDYDNEVYDRSRLISFAPGGGELRLWSIKVGLGVDVKSGNTKELDYTAKVSIKRQASVTRLMMDYVGNVSKTDDGNNDLIKTVENHRFNMSFDYFETIRFFYVPIFLELYRDPFVNIDLKTTLGAGLGYKVIDTPRTELTFSGGPAYMKTTFSSVEVGDNASETTPAAALNTLFDFELTKTLDFIAKYNITVANNASGGYMHHMVLTIENDITDSLEIDATFTWDRTSYPAKSSNGTIPDPDDYRMTFGISYDY